MVSGIEEIKYCDAISRLEGIGAIKKCSPCAGQFLSSYFLVDRSNGSTRFVLNLKKLNKFITTDHFKMEDIRTAIKLLSKDSFLASIDLRDAFNLISIQVNNRKFLRFSWKGQLFEFTCLPFGLCTAPWVFTKLLKPVANLLRKSGHMSVVYLDDWLCLGKTYNSCQINVQKTIEILVNLGFVINYEKSDLTPDKKCQYLGFILDSSKMTIELPEKKKEKILSKIKEIKNKASCRIRDFAQLVGSLTAACPAVEYGWLHTKSFERHRYLGLLRSQGNYDQKFEISSALITEFDWWLNTIPNTSNPIRSGNYKFEIFSDASGSGWGAFCKNELTHGFWTDLERKEHINYLELLAAYLGLKCFAKNLRDCEILLRIDNTTAISYINRMGGVQFPKLNEITQKIWSWCAQRKLWLFASYIASKDNIEADRGSRIRNIDTEWELSDVAYSQVVKSFGVPNLDLFASRCKAKCENYCSWHRDPEAFAVDAFTLNWKDFDFYAFPPFSMILKVVRKIIADQAQGIIVIPKWFSQPWYPLLVPLFIEPPILF